MSLGTLISHRLISTLIIIVLVSAYAAVVVVLIAAENGPHSNPASTPYTHRKR